MKTVWVNPPPPAKVAPYRPLAHTPIKYRSCAEVGVCKALTPGCGLCAQRGPDEDPDDPDADAFYRVANGVAVAIASLMTVVFIGVTAGYLYAHWVQ